FSDRNRSIGDRSKLSNVRQQGRPSSSEYHAHGEEIGTELIESGRRIETVLRRIGPVGPFQSDGHVASDMRGDAGDDGELHTRRPSQNRAHVWSTGVAEMDGPQPADSGAISVHPVLQRLVVEIEEDRNEMQDEGRLAIVPAFSDLLDGDDLIEL